MLCDDVLALLHVGRLQHGVCDGVADLLGHVVADLLGDGVADLLRHGVAHLLGDGLAGLAGHHLDLGTAAPLDGRHHGHVAVGRHGGHVSHVVVAAVVAAAKVDEGLDSVAVTATVAVAAVGSVTVVGVSVGLGLCLSLDQAGEAESDQAQENWDLAQIWMVL